MMNADAENKNYATNLSYYAPADTTSILYKNFQFMNQQENYLLLIDYFCLKNYFYVLLNYFL